MKVERPILRYHGGKWLLAKWIISHLPKHRIYVEPFGGAASVLLQKPRSYAEVYNDMDGEVVNLFFVARERGTELAEAIRLTPYARSEFELSYEPCADPLEGARRTVIRSFMGFGSGIQSHQRTGFRANSNRSGTTPAHDWNNYPEKLGQIINRLRGVVIENRNWMEIIDQHDTHETLFYLDPPYVLSTRFKKEKTKVYKYEFTDAEHVELCERIQTIKGMAVLSGYDNDIYNRMLNGWTKVEKKTLADGARERTEILWIKPTTRSNTLF